MMTKSERSEGDIPMRQYASDIAFTPAVKAIQSRKGSRSAYSKVEKGRGWQMKVTPELTLFLSELDMFYLGTANAEGQPYIQYRGGSPGFLKVVNDKTLGFADFAGNQQYITLGNLSENPKAFIFLMDYAHSRRFKLWGTARAVEDDPVLLDQLREPSYPGEVERAILFTIEAWHVNCPQHIHKRFSQETVASVVKQLQSQVQELQAKLDKFESKEIQS
jgi:predicted pyridoxine 5'-phosphate oxidase superfamily flavin-nucleotide-binding protein